MKGPLTVAITNITDSLLKLSTGPFSILQSDNLGFVELCCGEAQGWMVTLAPAREAVQQNPLLPQGASLVLMMWKMQRRCVKFLRRKAMRLACVVTA